ncbi:hypothetical protein BJ742DRAFT_794613 [Cladochytrium replicatum]|nr:hypothetical protein BJ742DRAFT_794613 [Cladochytrium replicatum]
MPISTPISTTTIMVASIAVAGTATLAYTRPDLLNHLTKPILELFSSQDKVERGTKSSNKSKAAAGLKGHQDESASHASQKRAGSTKAGRAVAKSVWNGPIIEEIKDDDVVIEVQNSNKRNNGNKGQSPTQATTSPSKSAAVAKSKESLNAKSTHRSKEALNSKQEQRGASKSIRYADATLSEAHISRARFEGFLLLIIAVVVVISIRVWAIDGDVAELRKWIQYNRLLDYAADVWEKGQEATLRVARAVAGPQN